MSYELISGPMTKYLNELDRHYKFNKFLSFTAMSYELVDYLLSKDYTDSKI